MTEKRTTCLQAGSEEGGKATGRSQRDEGSPCWGKTGWAATYPANPANPPQDGRQLVPCAIRSQMKNFFVKAVKASKLSGNLWVEKTFGKGFRKRQLLWRPMTVPICRVSMRDFPHTRAPGDAPSPQAPQRRTRRNDASARVPQRAGRPQGSTPSTPCKPPRSLGNHPACESHTLIRRRIPRRIHPFHFPTG